MLLLSRGSSRPFEPIDRKIYYYDMAVSISRNTLVDRLQDSYKQPYRFDRDSYIMDLFHYQYSENTLYRQYGEWLGKDPSSVTNPGEIPLLPISAFKNHDILTGTWIPQMTFRSSGTTSAQRSRHLVRDVQIYLDHALYLWEKHFGHTEQYCFLALLPGYVERGESSLVCMVDYFIRRTKQNGSDYILGKEHLLSAIYRENQKKNIKTVLFGVSYALIAMIEKERFCFENLWVLETGGMKGLREDLTKEELIFMLQDGFGTNHVFSEYGMTELFSQAYTTGATAFNRHDYLSIQIRQLQDPLSPEVDGKQGIVGCIDLANIDTCAFILTEDSGYTSPENTFYLTGRTDNADIRGCNLLLSDTGFTR